MAGLPPALMRPRTLRRCLSIAIFCVCSLMLFFAYSEVGEHFTFASIQLELDSEKERRLDGAKERNVEPLALKKMLGDPSAHVEEPSTHLDDDIRLQHDAIGNAVRMLNSTSLEIRGKYQKLAMKRFCADHPSRGVKPPKGTRQSQDLYKHLLYNDETKIIFCYVPKIGCSNWKRMFAALEKLIDLTNPRIRPPEEVLSAVPSLFDLSPSEREVRLKSYFKFVMVRNPFERIVSVYRSKILPPLTIEHRSMFPDRVKYYMLHHFESERLAAWWNSSRDEGISPSFDSFLRYLSIKQERHANEHLLTMLDLCFPCVVDYDVFISFKNLPDDAFRVMDMFGIPHDYYRNVENHPEYSTSDLVGLYFGGMSEEERRERVAAFDAQVAAASIKDSPPSSPTVSVIRSLVGIYKDELDFYYTLHPEERDKYTHLWSHTPHTNVSAT